MKKRFIKTETAKTSSTTAIKKNITVMASKTNIEGNTQFVSGLWSASNTSVM